MIAVSPDVHLIVNAGNAGGVEDVTQVTLTATTGGALVPFTFGAFFKEGDIPSAQALQSSTTQNFQAIVKNRWPDGSVKVAVCSGRATLPPLVGTPFKLSRGPVPPAANAVALSRLQQLAPQASVQLVSGTTTYAVELQSLLSAPRDQFIAGPEMSEWRFSAALNGVLLVQFDVRLYADDSVGILPTLQNGFQTGATSPQTGRVILTVNGTARFDSTTDRTIYHHQRLAMPTPECEYHWYGAEQRVTPAHDTAYMRATRMVPNFITASQTTAQLNSFAGTWSFAGIGNLPGNSLGGGGDHPSIGFMSKWDSAYVVTGDVRAYRSVLRNSFATGSYSIQSPDATTQQPISFLAYPTNGRPGRTGGELYFSGQYGTEWDVSHAWSPGYLAYLVSGTRWHMEECQYAAQWVYLWSVIYRNGSDGLMRTYFQTRGIGWGYRNLALATCITPDGDPQRAGYINCLEKNALWHSVNQTNNLGWLLDTGITSSQPGLNYPSGWRDSPFTTDICVYCFAWAAQLKVIPAGAASTALDALVRWLCKGIVDRLGDGSDPTKAHYRYRGYMMTYTEKTTVPLNHADLFPNWGRCFEVHYNRANAPDLDAPDTPMANSGVTTEHERNLANWFVKNSFDGTSGNYYEWSLGPLSMAVETGTPGAAATWARLSTVSNWNRCVGTLVNDARMGIQPRAA